MCTHLYYWHFCVVCRAHLCLDCSGCATPSFSTLCNCTLKSEWRLARCQQSGDLCYPWSKGWWGIGQPLWECWYQALFSGCSTACYTVLPSLRINPYFTDISGLSWTTEGYQQNKRFYGFLAINCSAISVHMRIIVIIMHVIQRGNHWVSSSTRIIAII